MKSTLSVRIEILKDPHLAQVLGIISSVRSLDSHVQSHAEVFKNKLHEFPRPSWRERSQVTGLDPEADGRSPYRERRQKAQKRTSAGREEVSSNAIRQTVRSIRRLASVCRVPQA